MAEKPSRKKIEEYAPTLNPEWVNNIIANKDRISLRLRLPLQQLEVMRTSACRQLITLSVIYVTNNYPLYAATIIDTGWGGLFNGVQLADTLNELEHELHYITANTKNIGGWYINEAGIQYLSEQGVLVGYIKEKLDQFRLELDEIVPRADIAERATIDHNKLIVVKAQLDSIISQSGSATFLQLSDIIAGAGYQEDPATVIQSLESAGVLHQRRYRTNPNKVKFLDMYVLGRATRV